MDNLDILLIILSKMDDNTLEKLLFTSLWPDVKNILGKNQFWYLRSQELAGRTLLSRDTDWKKIYQDISWSKQEDLLAHHNLDTIDSLLVIEEVFGTSFWTEDELIASVFVNNAIRVNSKEILDYMLASPRFSLEELVEEGLPSVLMYDQLDMFKYLMNLRPITNKRELITLLLEWNVPKIADYLLGSDEYVKFLKEWLPRIISGGHTGTTEVVFRKYPKLIGKLAKEDELRELARESIRAGNIAMTTLLMLADQQNSSRLLLHSAIRGRHIDSIKHALTLISPATDDNQALELAVSTGNEDIVRLILQHPDVNPNSNLEYVSRYVYTSNYKPTILDLIIQDPRTDIESMDDSMIGRVVYGLGYLILPVIEGLKSGVMLASKNLLSNSGVLGVLCSREDIYSALLRFLVIKRPNNEAIFRWLASSNYPEVVLEAARCVRNKNLKCSAQAVPLRELILAILYPTMTLEEVILVLRSEQDSEVTVINSCMLVGAYIGSRDMK